MVDQESRSYRPRRAFIEPEAEPTPPPAPDPAPAPATVRRPAAPNFDDEDAPKPLYRDEYLPQTLYRPERTTNGSATPAGAGGQRRVDVRPSGRRPRVPTRTTSAATTPPSGPSPSPRGPAGPATRRPRS